MARGTITPTVLGANAGTAGTATALDGTNFHVLVTNDGRIYKHFIEVTNAGTVAGTISIPPGAYPPAFEGASPGTVSPAGTLQIAVSGGGTAFITVDGAGYVQADGKSIYINPSSGMSGNIFAFEMPLNL